MKKFLPIIIIILCQTAFAQNQFKQIDSLLSKANGEGKFNGIVLIGNNGTIDFDKSYGFANFEKKTAIDINTQFYIASISKQFTATAILILVEKGKLEINQPISDIVSNFPYENITIHHLLSNTSGIVDYIDYFAEKWNKRKQANTDDVVNYLIEIKPKTNFEPGVKFEYSNTNYVLLAKIIEIISKESYPSFLENNIFKTCELNQTYATYKPYFSGQDSNVAFGYVFENEKLIKNENSNVDYIDRVNYLSGIQGDGSIVTTAFDLFLWHKTIISNKIISESSKQLMFKQTVLSDGTKSYYGYGWYTDGQIADHTGSWPGYQTRIIMNLETGVVGISLKNVEVSYWDWIGEFDKLIKK